MIFVKCALFFLALLSISTAAPIVDGNQGLFNRPSHSVEKRATPEGLPVEHHSPPHEAQAGLQAHLLYILKKKGEISVTIPIICLGPVVDEHGHPIPGRFFTLELVETHKVKVNQLHQQQHLGDMPEARRYFDHNVYVVGDKKLFEFSVRLSPQKVSEENVDMTALAEVSRERWELLLHDNAQLYHFIRETE